MKVPRPSWSALSTVAMLALSVYQTYLMRFPPQPTPAVTPQPQPELSLPQSAVAISFEGYWPIAAMAGLVVVNLLVQVWGRRRAVEKDSRLCGPAIDRLDKEQKGADSLAELPEMKAAKIEADDAKNERDRAVRELKAVKKDYGEERLRTFAHRVKKNLELARLEGKYPQDQLKEPRVTVRFAVYADLPLAQQIERILKEQTGWPIEVDGSNKPTLLPSDKGYKVLFDIGPMESFMPVAHAFDDGQLIDASVGARRSERWGDSEHLVVDVLPNTP